jgi:serine/threonine-protein kinase
VLLYVCLTQRLPYAGYQSVRLLRAISEGQFDPPRALRPELPEALEAILLRAMRLQAKDRFESIHALGQKLWDFASPRGQAQWRTFYFHTPTSQAAKAATLVDPTDVLDQAPEERDAGPTAAAADAAGTTDEPRPDATSSFDSRSALAKTAALGPPRADPAGVTKTAAASGGGEAAGQSQSDIAGESALSDAGRAGHARRSARFRLAALVVGFACIGVAVLLRASRSGPRPARPIAASAAAPAPPAVPAPVPAAASPPAPAATPLEAVPTAGPASAPAPVRREPAKRAEKAPAAEHSRKKHATHLRRAPNIDQNGIGIPTD